LSGSNKRRDFNRNRLQRDWSNFAERGDQVWSNSEGIDWMSTSSPPQPVTRPPRPSEGPPPDAETGKVHTAIVDRGFAFIQPSGSDRSGDRLFLHISNVVGFSDPAERDRVFADCVGRKVKFIRTQDPGANRPRCEKLWFDDQ
jgi:cold shock CspA family protein